MALLPVAGIPSLTSQPASKVLVQFWHSQAGIPFPAQLEVLLRRRNELMVVQQDVTVASCSNTLALSLAVVVVCAHVEPLSVQAN